MKFIPAAVSRKASVVALKASKNSPQILFVAGIAGAVGSTVLACRATLRLEEVLEDNQHKLTQAKEVLEDDRRSYDQKDYNRDVAVLKIRAAGDVAKLYAPALAVGVLSIAALTKSHSILTKRNAALSAAYATVSKAFDEYRKRVIDDVGEEKDREYRYGSETKQIMVEDKNGPKKKNIKTIGDGAESMYARFFAPDNPNYSPVQEHNYMYCRQQQNWANEKLRAKGYLTLNDVYKMLGMRTSSAGQIVGWVWNKNTGDNFVSFGLDDPDSPHAADHMYGDDLHLDFNVDGEIWSLIDEVNKR